MSEEKVEKVKIEKEKGGVVAQFKPKEDGINLQIPYPFPINRVYGFARLIGMEKLKGVTSAKILEGVQPDKGSLASTIGGYYPCLLTTTPFSLVESVEVSLSNGQSFTIIDLKIIKVVKVVESGEEPNFEELGLPPWKSLEDKMKEDEEKWKAKKAFSSHSMFPNYPSHHSSLSSLVDSAEEGDEGEEEEEEE